jgi:hypothetical protein
LQAVTATRIADYKECPRRYKYRYVLGLVPLEPQQRLFVGQGGHEALRAYYAGKTGDPAAWFEQWVDEQVKALPVGARDLPDAVREEIAVVRSCLAAYPAWSREHDDFAAVVPEAEFEVPIFLPGTHEVAGVHRGRFDGIAADRNGLVWLMENKFMSSFPSEDLLQLDEQAGFYLLAARRLWPDLRIRGVLYTVIRKVPPDRARSEIFRRYRVLRAEEELRTLEWNLYHSLRRIGEDRVWLPSPGLHCTWKCPYRTLCLLENMGKDPEVEGRLLFARAEDQEEVLVEA